MKKYTLETITEEENIGWNPEDNPVMVETAGFIPLEVRFKQFEQAGIKAQFNESDFSSQDYRDMYLGPNTEIYPSDDYDTVMEKLAIQEEIRRNILERGKKEDSAETVVSTEVDKETSDVPKI